MSTFSHVIQVPPMTDQMGLIGHYRNLMATLDINCDILANFHVVDNLSHPIPEAQDILCQDYENTYQVLNVSKLLHGTLTLVNMVFMNGSCVFMFQHPD